jgi:hypothetical protein
MKVLREKGIMSEAYYRVTIKPLNIKELEKNQRFGIIKILKMKKEKWNKL